MKNIYKTSDMDMDMDMVDVVRCRDCMYAHMTYDGECKYCDIITMIDEGGDPADSIYLPGDWFCAEGKRKDDNE